MSVVDEPAYRAFMQQVIDNIKKHGFPEKQVAFDLEKMYQIAERRGINLNKALEALAAVKIGHNKTPDKIIFYPADQVPSNQEPADPISTPFGAIDPSLFANLDLSALKGLDPARIGQMNIGELVSVAGQIMAQMSPAQLDKMRCAYEGMSAADREKMVERAKELGLIK